MKNLKRINTWLRYYGIEHKCLFYNGSQAISIKEKIPFEISTSSNDIPNETTRKAMILAEAKELGLIPDDSPIFSNVDDMMEFLDGE